MMKNKFTFVVLSFFMADTAQAKCVAREFDGAWIAGLLEHKDELMTITSFGCGTVSVSHKIKFRGKYFSTTLQFETDGAWHAAPKEMLFQYPGDLSGHIKIEKAQYAARFLSNAAEPTLDVQLSGVVAAQVANGPLQRHNVSGDARIVIKKTKHYDSTCDAIKDDKKLVIWVGHLSIKEERSLWETFVGNLLMAIGPGDWMFQGSPVPMPTRVPRFKNLESWSYTQTFQPEN